MSTGGALADEGHIDLQATAVTQMNGGPATVYGARAFAAFREFYDQRDAGNLPSGQGQPAGHEHGIGQLNGHQHAG